MPKISSIQSLPYEIPLKAALAWGKGHELAVLKHVLVRVTLDDGSSGIAEATPRPSIYGETAASIHAILAQEIAPLALGTTIESLADSDRLSQKLSLIKNNQTAKGAFNMALYGAFAQALGQSLSQVLDVQQAAIQPSYIVGTGTEAEVLADVSAIYAAGVRVFKVKVGKQISSEMASIQQLQARFADARFYVDANECLSLPSAPQILNDLQAMGMLYCEEALPVRQLRQRYELRQQTTLPIIGDDSCFSFEDVQREIDFETVDIINIKTPRTGYSESTRILELALSAQKGVMLGSQASSLLGSLMTALFAGKTGITHPTECSFFLKTQTDLSLAPVIRDGWLSLADVQAAYDELQATL